MNDPHGFENQEFESNEEMVWYLTEHADSVDRLTIMVVNDMTMTGPNGEKAKFRDRCGLLELWDC